jgi:hypothetical protein
MAIEVIDKIKPKNGLNFKIANCEDIAYDNTISVKEKIDNISNNVNSELVAINHKLDDYPMVQLRYVDYGAGIGGAGETPCGGTNSIYNDSKFRVEYNDMNNLTLYTSADISLTKPTIQSIDNNKYIITDSVSKTSILVRLI